MLRPRNSDYRECRKCGGPTSYWASVSPSPSVEIVCAKCGAYVLWLDPAGRVVAITEGHKNEGASVERLSERSVSNGEEQSVRQLKESDLSRQGTNPTNNLLVDFTSKQDNSVYKSIPAYYDSPKTISKKEKYVSISFEKDGSDAWPVSKNRYNVVPFSRNQSLETEQRDPGRIASQFGYLFNIESDTSDEERRKLLQHEKSMRNKRVLDENQAFRLTREPGDKAPLANTLVTCPRCGTLFQVDRTNVPEGHQVVRCSRCEHQWHQRIS